jgi:hypothetical protein
MVISKANENIQVLYAAETIAFEETEVIRPALNKGQDVISP